MGHADSRLHDDRAPDDDDQTHLSDDDQARGDDIDARPYDDAASDDDEAAASDDYVFVPSRRLRQPRSRLRQVTSTPPSTSTTSSSPPASSSSTTIPMGQFGINVSAVCGPDFLALISITFPNRPDLDGDTGILDFSDGTSYGPLTFVSNLTITIPYPASNASPLTLTYRIMGETATATVTYPTDPAVPRLRRPPHRVRFRHRPTTTVPPDDLHAAAYQHVYDDCACDHDDAPTTTSSSTLPTTTSTSTPRPRHEVPRARRPLRRRTHDHHVDLDYTTTADILYDPRRSTSTTTTTSSTSTTPTTTLPETFAFGAARRCAGRGADDPHQLPEHVPRAGRGRPAR